MPVPRENASAIRYILFKFFGSLLFFAKIKLNLHLADNLSQFDPASSANWRWLVGRLCTDIPIGVTSLNRAYDDDACKVAAFAGIFSFLENQISQLFSRATQLVRRFAGDYHAFSIAREDIVRA
jgi:hypothetical protein